MHQNFAYITSNYTPIQRLLRLKLYIDITLIAPQIIHRYTAYFTSNYTPLNRLLHLKLYNETTLTPNRWRRTFLWCSLCSWSSQMPDKICSPCRAYRSMLWPRTWGAKEWPVLCDHLVVFAKKTGHFLLYLGHFFVPQLPYMSTSMYLANSLDDKKAN